MAITVRCRSGSSDRCRSSLRLLRLFRSKRCSFRTLGSRETKPAAVEIAGEAAFRRPTLTRRARLVGFADGEIDRRRETEIGIKKRWNISSLLYWSLVNPIFDGPLRTWSGGVALFFLMRCALAGCYLFMLVCKCFFVNSAFYLHAHSSSISRVES